MKSSIVCRMSMAFAGMALLPAASGCTIPVFRFALDRWAAETWKLETPTVSFTTEPLATTLRNLGATSPLNLEAAPAEGESRLLFPPRDGEAAAPPVAAWKGTLDQTTWGQITDSPGRKEVARRILSGESAVWIVAEGTDQAGSRALAERLAKRLTFLESAAQLPEIDPNDPDSQLGPGPELRLKFSVLPLQRAEPAEATTVAMLAGKEGAERFPAAESFAALVFGRGRVLGAWSVTELTDSFIDDTTLYLIKACTCQAKALNPGWDLLMQVDWDGRLKEAASAAVPPPQANVPETTHIQPVEEPPVAGKGRNLPLTQILGGLAAMTLVILTFVARSRKGRLK